MPLHQVWWIYWCLVTKAFYSNWEWNCSFFPNSSFLVLIPFSLCLFLIKGNVEEAGRLLGSKNVHVNCLDEVWHNCASVVLDLAIIRLGPKACLVLNNFATQTLGSQNSSDVSSLQLNNEPLKSSKLFFKGSLMLLWVVHAVYFL